MWFAQYTITLWWALFLIVSSHDFEEDYNTKADTSAGQDWGKFQIENSVDLHVTRNKWIDCFLTAGLGCHRVHHLLPQQKSGWSNNITAEIVSDVCKDYNMKWADSQNFFTERLPILFRYYLMSKPRGQKTDNFFVENLSLWGILKSINFIFIGFKGEGSI